MKANKRIFAFFMALIMTASFSVFGTIQCFAHSAMLNVSYDDCKMLDAGDGIDEKWYNLIADSICYHYPEDRYTIKYYFEESSATDQNYTWTTEVSATIAQEIKDAYVNSMKKWNNVYFYSYNSSGIVEKRSVINIIEGTASDHNLSICPMAFNDPYRNKIAITEVMGNPSLFEEGAIEHRHYNDWRMRVNVLWFSYEHHSKMDVDALRERNGAHEFGHVLGLFDIDAAGACGAHNPNKYQHHEELLMGYGEFIYERSVDIKYKDIAGAAITRGFHTDADHKWLSAGVQSDGQYKLICSICNGVRKVDSLSGYTYGTYGACGNTHTVASGNMFAVASYGNKDYYKCRHCRYVAPFSALVTQNYTKTNAGPKHKCVNTVTGLGYTFYEAHSIQSYIRYDNTYHYTGCVCGFVQSQKKHVVRMVTSRTGVCTQCDAEVIVDNGTISPWSTGETVSSASGSGGWYLTEKGSYVLPNGVIVLVPEDVEGYLTGEWTLPDDFPWSAADYEPISQ